MFFQKVLVFILFLFFFLNGNCRKSNEPDLKAQVISYLISQSLTNSGTPCENFSLSEAACITSPDLNTVTCSSGEITRLKNLIEPSNLRTDPVLEKFFICWKNCNLLFNANEIICTGSKFSNNKAYREAQRSGTTNSSGNWGVCMNKCNKGEDVESGVKSTGATFPKTAY